LTTKRTKVQYVDDPAAVGQRIRAARERAGLSQRQLAFPGCSAAYLSRIEAGERTPSLQLLRELARLLGVSEAYLARGKDESAPEQRLLEAEIAARLGEDDLARRVYEEELSSPDAMRRATALEGLGQLAFRTDELDEAIRLLEQAASLRGDGVVEERALVDTLGRCYAAVGELDAAIGLYERALRAAEEREDVLDTVRFAILLSYALSDAGQLGRAEETLGRALSYVDQLADPQARVRLYWAQCRLHILEDRPDLAERYGRKVIELLELTEDSRELARAYRLMAIVELDRTRPEEALALLEQSRSALAQSGDELEEAAIVLNEARAYAQLGELERAASMAMSLSGAFATRPSEAGQGYTTLATTFAQAGDRARAIELLELACGLLERAPNRFLVEAYAQLSDLLEAEGKKDAAFEVMRKALRTQTSQVPQRPPR
jgi:tetratricopeptide (TPR) repeat protein